MVKKVVSKNKNKNINKVSIVEAESEESDNAYAAQPGERTFTFGADVPEDDGEVLDGEDDNDNSGSENDLDVDISEEGDSGEDDGDDNDFGGGALYSDEEGVDVPIAPEDMPPSDPAVIEERRKTKRLEKLDKRIKLLQKKQDKLGTKAQEGKYEREVKEIKNKHKRQEVVIRRRQVANAKAKLKSLQTKKLREELGEEEVPKGIVKTIESMRVADETLMDDVDDEDIAGEQNIDEFAKYFNRETTPKILITTNRRPKGDIFDFLKELKLALPNCEYYPRENFRIKEIIEWSKERDFTDIMVFQEKWGNPHSVILSHLPEGPTATFRVSGVKLNADIKNHGANLGMDKVAPELILNNFDTMLGSRLGRMIASLFPQDPELEKRRVITWHNQRDFIFFRHHRYQFEKDGSRAHLSEIGPRFTLKLHKLQLGTLNSRFGEFEFLYKPKDGVNRKKFVL